MASTSSYAKLSTVGLLLALFAVQKEWNSFAGLPVMAKIKQCGEALLAWSEKRFGDFHTKIVDTERSLAQVQKQPTSQESLDQCVLLEEQLNDLQRVEEAHWHMRSRVSEVRDGDRNTAYFHHKANQRYARNRIKGLLDTNNVMKREDKEIEDITLNFYNELFKTEGPRHFAEALAGTETRVTGEMNAELTKPYTSEEFYHALSQMHSTKAPGPDGMHAIFYKKFWHIVGDDVARCLNGIVSGEVPPCSMNHTHVALIPKVKSPSKITEFRPISLCNVIYKILSKAMANRLKTFLPLLVSENQSAFVPKRLITDNALIAMEMFHSMKKRSKGRHGTMALKLDMRKAYDRVEWPFLKALMQKLGFAMEWIELVMSCISSVSYSFIVNGRPRGHIIPSRGLRQGDLISPYLFILVAEAFSGLLHKATREKAIHGAKASRSGPQISHLFFADDSLLFARANRRECAEIASLLSKYEVASGQSVNLEKSEVSFSKGVTVPVKTDLGAALGMTVVEKHGKYLGLPCIEGRARRSLFTALKDRVWKKLQGWKEKFLSQAGKEILIKAVIQAIPTYLMGVYKLPDTLVKEIESLCARFWWGGSETKRRMHWMSWSSLCKPKFVGGMGFRDLKVFNEALLAKQIWRLVQYPSSLCAQVLKAKYFPKSCILQSALGIKISYAWRSIWSSKALFIEGMLWRVGNGLSINVWNDPWLPDEDGRFATTTPPPGREQETVAEYIDFHQNDWNMQKIEATFNERDRTLIQRIPLSERRPSDSIQWAYSDNGAFVVKYAYLLGCSIDMNNCDEVWSLIWKAPITPKVRLFLWKLANDIIPVRSLLYRRHIAEDDTCFRCKSAAETVEHALILCPEVKEAWQNSPCSEVLALTADSPLELIRTWDQQLTNEQFQLATTLAWETWFARNQLLHESKTTPAALVRERASKLIEDFNTHATSRSVPCTNYPKTGGQAWTGPQPGQIKINVDAHLDDEGYVGLGAVARDKDGKVKFAVVRRTRARWPPVIAEAKACLLGLKHARAAQYRCVAIESDCLSLISCVTLCSPRFDELALIVDDIQALVASFDSISWSHTKREGNEAAHFMARFLPFGTEQYWQDCYPEAIAPYVRQDALS